jgi:hypothetical protein
VSAEWWWLRRGLELRLGAADGVPLAWLRPLPEPAATVDFLGLVVGAVAA